MEPINKKERLYFEDGKMYFSKGTERFFYFSLTMIVLVLYTLNELGIV